MKIKAVAALFILNRVENTLKDKKGHNTMKKE